MGSRVRAGSLGGITSRFRAHEAACKGNARHMQGGRRSRPYTKKDHARGLSGGRLAMCGVGVVGCKIARARITRSSVSYQRAAAPSLSVSGGERGNLWELGRTLSGWAYMRGDRRVGATNRLDERADGPQLATRPPFAMRDVTHRRLELRESCGRVQPPH